LPARSATGGGELGDGGHGDNFYPRKFGWFQDMEMQKRQINGRYKLMPKKKKKERKKEI
jgi:hypothetical protein